MNDNNDLIVLKALADENRLKIISLLLSNDLCVGALSKRLEISKAAVSQHLQTLRKAGIVKGEKRGYFTHYWVNKELLIQTAEFINNLTKLEIRKNNCQKSISEKHSCCD